MQLAFSTNAYTRWSLPDALRSIADLGFAGAEILCDDPHWRLVELGENSIREVVDVIAQTNLSISNLNANTANYFFDPLPAENTFEPSLSTANEAHRRWRIANTARAIEVAAAIGAGCVSVTSGKPTPGCAPELSLTLFVDSLKEICAIADRFDVCIGVEYEPGLLVERAEELAIVFERVGSDRLGANWDIGHSFLDGESPEDAVRLIGGRIWNVHVEDIAARKHFHLVPGDGDLPFQRYIEALNRVGYDRFLTVELYTYPEQPETVGKRSLDFLGPLL